MVKATTTTVETGLAEGAPNAATEKPTPADAAAEAEAKISPYKKRLAEKNLRSVMYEAPAELIDMADAAALKLGDIALSSWMRIVVADAVNAAGLTHADANGTVVPWTFDKSTLDTTPAKSTGTRNLTPEQKKAKEEKVKEEVKDERAYVQELLRTRRQQLKAGKTAAQVLEEARLALAGPATSKGA
jgi:hypothetical protein